ncbi:MAG: hypothetical protein ACWA5R_07330 [bacterium]
MFDNPLLVWSVAAIFYIPLHVGLPVLIVFLSQRVPDRKRSELIRKVIKEALLSVVLIFPFVAYLWAYSMAAAIGLLILGLLLPLILLYRALKDF